jgi:hypothetical protein
MDAYATATITGGTAIDETDRLIASDKVEGTAVYNRQGERLGTVHNFMVDKSTGRVAYVVMPFGGFLGMGESYIRCPGGYSTTLRARAGSSSISTAAGSRKRRVIWRATCRTGPTGPTAAGSTNFTACRPIGA